MENVATDELLTLTLPRSVEPSLNCTLPVAEGATVAVKVMFVPTSAVVALTMRFVVVDILPTLTFDAALKLARWVASP